MPTPLCVLILEDQPTDAELILHELRQAGFDPDWRRVETEPDYHAALDPGLDLILADYTLPQFDAIRALQLLQERKLDIPFIVVTGSIGEEAAVECMKQGAADYLLKDRLARLGLAVAHALEQSRLREEKRHTEEALRQSEDRFRDLIEHIHDLIGLHDLQGNILSINPAATKLLGFDQDTLLKMNLRDILMPEVRDQFDDYLAVIQRDGQASGRMLVQTRSGERRIWEYSNSLRTDFVEKPVIRAMARDVTEREQAEELLRQSEELYRLLAENISDVIWILDLETSRFRYVSPSVERLSGFTAKETMAQDMTAVLTPESARRLAEILPGRIAEFQQGRARYHLDEVEQPRRDGSTVWIEITTSFRINPNNGHLEVYGVSRDISERKRMEGELQKTYATLYTALDQSQAGIAIADENGKITFINKSGLAIGGREEKKLAVTIDQYVANWQLFHFDGSKLKDDEVPLARAILYGETNSLEFLVKREDRDVVVLTNAAPILDKENKINGGVAVFLDITERKQVEETLQEKEHLLSESQRTAHIGSWNYHIDTDTLQFSDEMYRLLDVSPQEFTHNADGFLSLISSVDHPQAALWMNQIKDGLPVKELEFSVFRRNGELRYIHIRGAFVYETNSDPARFTGTAMDITERKLAEIQIHQQIERLTALRKIDQAITTGLNLQPSLNILLSEVLTQLQVDAADILLLNPDEQNLEFAAGRGFRTDALQTVRVPLSDSHAGRAVTERRRVQIDDLKGQPANLFLTTLLAEEEFSCYYSVPLIAKGEVKGVLEVYNRAPLQPYPDWFDFLETLAGQAAIAIDNVTLYENLQKSNNDLLSAYDATIEGWSRALDLRDKETEGHTRRVTEMTIKLAARMGIHESELVHIRRGALLHDIGKLGVPDHILLKADSLTEQEWALMRKHPQYAYDLLEPIAFLRPALDIPYCHHEKWDGSGYPRGLKGGEIPLSARLFAAVDVYDALTSDRPYRPAWTMEKALAHIQSVAGSYLDPQVVEYFLEAIKQSAPGS